MNVACIIHGQKSKTNLLQLKDLTVKKLNITLKEKSLKRRQSIELECCHVLNAIVPETCAIILDQLIHHNIFHCIICSFHLHL